VTPASAQAIACVIGVVRAQAHVTRRPRYGIRGARVERRCLVDETARAAVDLGRRDVDIFPD